MKKESWYNIEWNLHILLLNPKQNNLKEYSLGLTINERLNILLPAATTWNTQGDAWEPMALSAQQLSVP